MTQLEKLEKDVKKLYIGYEDRNPTNKALFKLAKKTLKNGLTSFEYNAVFAIDAIAVNEFKWESIDLKYYSTWIANHLSYLNKKFNGYFLFTQVEDVDFMVKAFNGVYCDLIVTYKVNCDKVE